MSVLLVTSIGELVVDLFVDDCPLACQNFLKLCAVKYYHQCLLFNVQPGYICQLGDPTGTGRGGTSIYGLTQGSSARFFRDELVKTRKVNKVGYVGMAHFANQSDTNQSQFFITLRGDDMLHLGQEYTIFGEIAEGIDVLEKINALYCDEDQRPYQDVRILHTYILDDPTPDVSGCLIPPDSPVYEYPKEEQVKRRIPYNEAAMAAGKATEDDRDPEEIEQAIREKEAKSRAIVLEMVGDLPDADIKPPEEVLFVCKLNPVTRDEDLELIFSRFGTIKSCEIIRDHKTGDSLNYAFIEFETEEACIQAYEKMNNVLIDDRRIKVDFSQSVSKLWNRFLLKPRQAAKPGMAKPFVKTERTMDRPVKREEGDHNKQSYHHSRGGVLESKEDEGAARSSNRRSNSRNRKDPEYHNHRDRKDYSDRDRDHNRDRDRNRNGSDRDREYRRRDDSRERNKRDDHNKDHRKDYDRDRERERNKDRDHDRKGDRGEDRHRHQDNNRERDCVREKEHDEDRKSNRKRSRSRSTQHNRHRDHSRDRKSRKDSRDRR